MAGTNNPEHHVPMLDTAEAIVDSDDRIEPFILSLFPDATQNQLTMIRLFAVGWFMEGEEMGRILAIHATADDLSSYNEQVQIEDLESHETEEHTILMKGFCSRHK